MSARIFDLSKTLEPPTPGNPVFTPNEGETGSDAALTIIWSALEYFAEPSNDADVWGMGEALLHSLDIVGLIRCDEPTPAPAPAPDAGHAAEAMIDFWSDVHREASESLGMTPDVAHRAFDAITVLALEEFPWTTMGGHQTRAVLYALRDAGLRIVEVDHTAPARTAGTETGGMK